MTPHNGTIAYPQRGLFVVFSGELVHGVLPPAQIVEPQEQRDVLVINWWKKRPSKPACNEVPKSVHEKNFLDAVTLNELSTTLSKSSHPEQADSTCMSAEMVTQSGLFTTFGGVLGGLEFPVPSEHRSGEVAVIDWTTLTRERSEL